VIVDGEYGEIWKGLVVVYLNSPGEAGEIN